MPDRIYPVEHGDVQDVSLCARASKSLIELNGELSVRFAPSVERDARWKNGSRRACIGAASAEVGT
jgi:hypothetical protein